MFLFFSVRYWINHQREKCHLRYLRTASGCWNSQDLGELTRRSVAFCVRATRLWLGRKYPRYVSHECLPIYEEERLAFTLSTSQSQAFWITYVLTGWNLCCEYLRVCVKIYTRTYNFHQRAQALQVKLALPSDKITHV